MLRKIVAVMGVLVSSNESVLDNIFDAIFFI